MRVTVVLAKGAAALWLKPEDVKGLPTKVEDRQIGVVEDAWRDGDSIMAEVRIDDPACRKLFT